MQLHIILWSSHQHEQEPRLYVCAFIHWRIYPQLVHVFRPHSFQEHYLLIIIYLFYL